MKRLFILSLLIISAFSLCFAHSVDNTQQVADTVIVVKVKEPLLKKVEKWYDNNMNYLTITALMTVESSFIPFPSEIVIPPAAYVACKPESSLNIYLVVFFGTLGAMLGALINYALAIYLGRPIIYRFVDSKLGHALFLSRDKIEKAELYFNKHGKISTFVGRLIPGIRQLISIPAGLAKMNIPNFLIYTFSGAFIWNAILAALGYFAHGQQDLIEKYSSELSAVFMGVIALGVIYLLLKNRKVFSKSKK